MIIASRWKRNVRSRKVRKRQMMLQHSCCQTISL
ncbi:hypothetical protein [Salmonella phage NINP13076]|nr:hypothetical protein [Salmonella phage NINP13076]